MDPWTVGFVVGTLVGLAALVGTIALALKAAHDRGRDGEAQARAADGRAAVAERQGVERERDAWKAVADHRAELLEDAAELAVRAQRGQAEDAERAAELRAAVAGAGGDVRAGIAGVLRALAARRGPGPAAPGPRAPASVAPADVGGTRALGA